MKLTVVLLRLPKDDLTQGAMKALKLIRFLLRQG